MNDGLIAFFVFIFISSCLVVAGFIMYNCNKNCTGECPDCECPKCPAKQCPECSDCECPKCPECEKCHECPKCRPRPRRKKRIEWYFLGGASRLGEITKGNRSHLIILKGTENGKNVYIILPSDPKEKEKKTWKVLSTISDIKDKQRVPARLMGSSNAPIEYFYIKILSRE